MTRSVPTSIGLVVAMLALVACGETPAEPRAIGRLARDVSAEVAAADSWIRRVDLIPHRYYPAVAAVNDEAGQSVVYVMGGFVVGRGTGMGSVRAYNVTTNTWTTKASLPRNLYWTNGAGVIDGKIYISGGVRHGELVGRHLYVYDPATDTWTQKRSMPSQGYSGVSGVINGQLYVLTSCIGLPDCSTGGGFFRYNPVTDRWTRLLQMPVTLHKDGMAATIGGRLYVVAGWPDKKVLEVYDPATGEWTTKSPLPINCELGAAAAVNGKLYVFGGMTQNDFGSDVHWSDATFAYDPTTDSWTEKAQLPSARIGMGATRVMRNGQPRIEVIGGERPENNLQYIP